MVKLKIWGEITLKTSYIVEQAIADLENETDPIIIVINSLGGTLSDAIAIANLLKSVNNPIITVAFGNCISAAAILFSLGKKRYIGQDLCYMIHQPYITSAAKNYNYTILKNSTLSLKSNLDLYLKYVITDEIHIPEEKIKELKKDGKDLYFKPSECLKYKIATNTFTSWKDLYKKEKINIEDKTYLYESFADLGDIIEEGN